MVLSEGEAQRLMEILADKAGIMQDTWHKVGPSAMFGATAAAGSWPGATPHPTWSQGPGLPGACPAAQKVLETPPPASSPPLPGMAG